MKLSAQALNPVQEDRAKHIDVKSHFVREQLQIYTSCQMEQSPYQNKSLNLVGKVWELENGNYKEECWGTIAKNRLRCMNVCFCAPGSSCFRYSFGPQ